MEPLQVLPKGIVDDPEECPFGRALKPAIGENGCTCYCPELAKVDRPSRALALNAASETSVEQGSVTWMVRLPEELARFNHEFNAGAFPELIGRDCQLAGAGGARD
jgi:hypothetical protein